MNNISNTMRTLWTNSHAKNDREENDYYATDPIAIKVLLENHDVKWPIREPACGEGHLSKALKESWHIVYSSDLIQRGYWDQINFFYTTSQTKGDIKSIITNPPYKYAQIFIEKAIDITPPGAEIIMFLKLQFMEWKERKKMFKKYPPKKILVSSSRIKCALNWDFENTGSSAVAYAWYIWENGYQWQTIIERVN